MDSPWLIVLFWVLVTIGGILTLKFYDQAGLQAVLALLAYLRIPIRDFNALKKRGKDAQIQLLEENLLEHVRLVARRGNLILDKLEGAITYDDRDKVRAVLLQYQTMTHLCHVMPSELPGLTITTAGEWEAGRARDWWAEFLRDWRMLRTHARETFPRARSHILRSRN